MRVVQTTDLYIGTTERDRPNKRIDLDFTQGICMK